MASKTHQRRVRTAKKRIAARMREEGLDPNSAADRSEYTRRSCARILENMKKRTQQ